MLYIILCFILEATVFIEFYDFFYAVAYLTCICPDSLKVFRRLFNHLS